MTTIATESGHWYTRDGTPCYTIIGRNGVERPTTLRDARKLDLLPSVTGIIRQASSFYLEQWKQEQLLMSALTCPHIEGETNGQWIERIRKDANEQAENARELGTAIHGAIEVYYQRFVSDPLYEAHIKATDALIQDKTGERISSFEAERSFANADGFGGKIDLVNERWVIDFKTKDFGEDKTAKDLCWDDHVMQLAACKQNPDQRCANVFISTSQPGLVLWHEWEKDDVKRGAEMFWSLLKYWYAKNRV